MAKSCKVVKTLAEIVEEEDGVRIAMLNWIMQMVKLLLSYISLKHQTKSGKVTVPNHNGDLKPGTLNSIYRQAGLK